jgi:hypothetical protein
MLRLLVLLAVAATAAAAELAFSRINRGWPNYSTAFNTTHDPSPNGEFATVGTFYTPPYNVKPREFGTIVIWTELPPATISFKDFTFSACVWSSLDQFIQNPGMGDVLNLNFVQPTAISRDGTSRGGRATYELRFTLTSSPLVLTSCQTYVLGVVARTDPARNGELYVPTAPTDGPSDVQAGNIVPFGWQYLIDAGGLTIYSGQAATELIVEQVGQSPRLQVARSNSTVRLSWHAAASCYQLESTDALLGPWLAVTNEPQIGSGEHSVTLPSTNQPRFFRLAR